MYLSLEIKDFDQFDKSISLDKKLDFKQRNNALLDGLERYILNKDNVLNATEIQKHLFPEVEADIFLSHAHADENKVISLAVCLEEIGFKVFVDSCVWENAFDLLKTIDEKHCKFENSDTYNYQKRNFSTANVYMILNAALHRMIEKSELFIFLGTENSFTIEDSIENQEFLKSPWVFSELNFVNQVVRYDNRQNLRPKTVKKSFSVEDAQATALDESLQVRFNKPTLDFSLSNQYLKQWLDSETNPFSKVSIKEAFRDCEDHIKSLENLYDLMKAKSEKREDIIFQQYINL